MTVTLIAAVLGLLTAVVTGIFASTDARKAAAVEDVEKKNADLRRQLREAEIKSAETEIAKANAEAVRTAIEVTNADGSITIDPARGLLPR